MSVMHLVKPTIQEDGMRIGYDPKGPIFVSYRQSDGTAYAERLDTYLRAGGLVPWRDLVNLPPGETAQRVSEAFDEGISNAVLIVTPELEHSEFVPQVELPPLLGLDADTGNAKPFHLLVLNTIAKDGSNGMEVDIDAPDTILNRSEYWPTCCAKCGRDRRWVLKNLKQYAELPHQHEFRQLYADLLDARLSARVAHLADKEVIIQTQTRPEGNARSRLSGSNRSGFVGKDADDPYDLIIRLRQDHGTGVPSVESLRALQETLPLLVDGLYAHGVERVRLDGSGHFSLLWAVGAALPITRMRRGSFVVEDPHQKRWYDQLPATAGDSASSGTACRCSGDSYRVDTADEVTDRGLFQVEADPEPADLGDDAPQDRPTKAAVLLEFGEDAHHKAFRRMVDGLSDCHAVVKIRVAGGATAPRFIPSGEGARLAREIAQVLRRLVNRTGVDEIHVACSLPTALAGLLGRWSNTLNLVLHEWGFSGTTGNRQYIPVIRIQPGMPGGPITEVFCTEPATDAV